jgi:hypothetical protein
MYKLFIYQWVTEATLVCKVLIHSASPSDSMRRHGQIKRAEVMNLSFDRGQAKALLRRLVVAKKIELHGAGRASAYVEAANPARA